jgi:hypothetical protein
MCVGPGGRASLMECGNPLPPGVGPPIWAKAPQDWRTPKAHAGTEVTRYTQSVSKGADPCPVRGVRKSEPPDVGQAARRAPLPLFHSVKVGAGP